MSQRGRAFPDQIYRASHGQTGSEKYPIVVIVNRNTASAGGDCFRGAPGP